MLQELFMAAFHFDLVSPEKLIFSGDVESVVVPGTEGEFTVLKDHAPFMSTLRRGLLEIAQQGANATEKFYVQGGFADVAPNGLTILADYAVKLEEFDAAKLDADIAEADVEFAAADEDDDGRRLASEKRDQLIELKALLKI
jgi:F-type H+-transporting ATPase subunit epsilon